MAKYQFSASNQRAVQIAVEKWKEELETGLNEWFDFHMQEINAQLEKGMRYADYDSISEFERRAEEQENDLEDRFDQIEYAIEQKVKSVEKLVSDVLDRTFEGNREYYVNLEEGYVWEYPGYAFKVRFGHLNYQAQSLLPKTVSASLDIGSFDANSMIEECEEKQEQTANQIVQEIANRHETSNKKETTFPRNMIMREDGGQSPLDF